MSKPVDSPLPDEAAVRTELARQIAALPAAKSLCPSDVARALAGSHPDSWSRLMPRIRHVAVDMAKQGGLVILRKGKMADPDDFRGVYRLGPARQD